LGNRPDIAELVEKSVLASPPDLLFKIINSLDSELSSKQIGEIIGHDQSISAQVLKLSNSSFFGFKGSIRTLDRAINILGTKTVRNIAVTTLLFAHTNKVRLWNLDIMNFWLHTFLVADITRELSQKIGLDGDESYIAGLLHDIGKLILYAQKQEKAEIFKELHNDEDILKYEKDTWGVTSSELSKMLLNKWNIPADIVDAISNHHEPDAESNLAKVVFIANEFANIVTDGNFKCSITYPLFKKLLDGFELPENDFNKMSMLIPGIVERGKMIMKVMSKQSGAPPIRRRMITRATLITPDEFSLTKCLLELLGFSVETSDPKEVKAYMDNLKEEEEQRKKEYDERLHPKFAEKEEEKEEDEEKKQGFFHKLFAIKKSSKVEGAEELEEETVIKPIHWNPLVVFEGCSPVEIDKASVTCYERLKDPSKSSSVNPLPFFFANPDIKTK